MQVQIHTLLTVETAFHISYTVGAGRRSMVTSWLEFIPEKRSNSCGYERFANFSDEVTEGRIRRVRVEEERLKLPARQGKDS